MTVVLLAFGWIVQKSINRHFVQQDVDELNAVAQALTDTLATLPANEPAAALPARLANAVAGHHNAQYRISMRDGSVIYATPGSDLSGFVAATRPVDQISINTVGVWQDHGQTFRGAVLSVPSERAPGTDALTIAVATGIDFHLNFLESFRNYLRLVTVAACLIAILATWLAVHRGHAPIRRISREIRGIRSDQLHVRLDAAAVPAELVELATSFNGMLERLENVFRRLSDFSGDIAHELRTPITNIKTQTEVALSQARSVEQYREILYSNLEEYERMAKMVGDMLFLAQADNHLLKPELVEIDLDAELRMLFDYFGAWAEERDVSLRLAGGRVCTLGDRLMIRRALSNLLSNAIRHTPTGKTVAVRIEGDARHARVVMANPGPRIPAQHLPHLFERFYRPDASRRRAGEGAGLGLAIAKSILDAHGGRITVSSTERQTVFEVRLPAHECKGPDDSAALHPG